MTGPVPQGSLTQDAARRRVDWAHWAVVIVVFGITGTLSVVFSRFLLSEVFRMDGSLGSGPWSYRAVYLLFIPPSYSVTLVLVGTAFGKHAYFRRRVLRMWGRVLSLRWPVHRLGL